MTIALLGYGTVGRGVYDLAKKNNITVVGVFCREWQEVPDGLGTADGEALVNRPDIDTVVEVLGGLHPAFDLVTAALKAGKNVVTANKYLLCEHYETLVRLSIENHCALRSTGAAGGGIPWLVNLARASRLDRVQSLQGIMNGTTNYILSQMSGFGISFSQALCEAQKLGYAEADSSDDIDGLDIRRKLAISANVAFGSCIGEKEIPVMGMRNVDEADILVAKTLHRICKLLAFAKENEDGSVSAVVEPAFLPYGVAEASVNGNYNVFSFTSELYGTESFVGQGAGRWPTASNVVHDLLDIMGGVNAFYTDKLDDKKVNNGELQHSYYVRCTARSAWLSENMAQRLNAFSCITKPISVEEMHREAEEMRMKDPSMFFASIF